MRAGQPVELARYTHRVGLTVPTTPDGLAIFRVPPALAAEARDSLEDLRVVDAEGRQWPYLFGHEAQNDELEVVVSPGTPKEGQPTVSIHRVTLPVRTVAPLTFRIDIPPQLVARSVNVRGTSLEGADVELGSTYWTNPQDAGAHLEVSLFAQRVTALWLEIENGDEAPLTIEHATLVQLAHELYLVAPAGEYGVVVGDPDAEPPTYDVEMARDLVLALEAAPATLGELETNPAYHEPTFFERSGWQTIVLSGVLGLVVLILFALTMRVARSEGGSGTGTGNGSGTGTGTGTGSGTRTGDGTSSATTASETGAASETESVSETGSKTGTGTAAQTGAEAEAEPTAES